MYADLPTVPLLAGQSRFFTRCPAKSWKCPAFCTKSDFFARAQFVTLPRCPDVNANHPIERRGLYNYGNSVRFLAKIPNGTAAESPCHSVFWNAIDFCRLYTSKKISMWALPTVLLFAGKSRFFTRNAPLKTLSRLAGLMYVSFHTSTFLTLSSLVCPLALRNMCYSFVCIFLSSFFLTAQYSLDESHHSNKTIRCACERSNIT